MSGIRLLLLSVSGHGRKEAKAEEESDGGYITWCACEIAAEETVITELRRWCFFRRV